MNRFLIFIISLAFFFQSSHAQTEKDSTKLSFLRETHMNLMLNTSFTGDISENENLKITPRINYLKWELKGKISKQFSFHFRQSLTKKAQPGETDKVVQSVDYANITWQPDKHFSLTAGKQLLCLGGYEFWVSGYKVKEFSLFNDCMNNYGTGVTASYHLTPKRSISLQIVSSKVGNDEETFCYGLPAGVNKSRIPLLGTLNYESFSANDEWQLRYSLSYGQQAAKKSLIYLTTCHVFRHNKLLAYWDINASYEGVDHKGIVSKSIPVNDNDVASTAQNAWYFSTVINADYRFSSHWNGFVKGTYECGGVARENGDFRKGVNFHEWQTQACAEYYPKKILILNFTLLAQYRKHITPSTLFIEGTDNSSRIRLMIGLVYVIPVF